MGWHYGFFWGFPWLLFWVVVVFLFFGRRRWYGPHSWQHTPSAREVLEERFAKGEISEEEFEKRMSVLKKHAK